MSKFADKVRKVAGLHSEMSAAFETENDAKADLLEQIIEEVLPALHALSSDQGDVTYSSRLGYMLRGVTLPSNSGSPHIVLTEDGRLLAMSSPTSPTRYLDKRDAARHLKPAAVLDRLNKLLDQQLNGKAARRSEQAIRIADKLDAITTLLRATGR
jgi:hypothetical protein